MTDLELAMQTLADTACSCVVASEGQTITSEMPGIRPLLNWLVHQPDCLRGAAVADKIIGKAAALLLIYGGVKEVYGVVLSDTAAEVLTGYGVSFSCGKRTPYIINRTGDGMCPMEQRVMNLDTPEQAYQNLVTLLQS